VADRGTEEPGLSAVAPVSPVEPSAPKPKRTIRERFLGAVDWTKRYFTDQDPTFWVAFTPALVICALLFVRNPASNYIFDEQEALLANPYVDGKGVGFWEVFKRDFWGLPPERTIGSYRPMPNIIWRLLWHVSKLPWLHHWVNVVGHAVNGALIASIVLLITRRRNTAWLAGGVFVTTALLTETVSGVVGIADVLGGLGVLLAVASLRYPMYAMPFACFLAVTFGLFSKESVIVSVPLITWAALVWAPAMHPEKPRRIARAFLAFAASAGSLVFYTWSRKKLFPIPLPAELQQSLPDGAPVVRRVFHEFLRWFGQPKLPSDPINNPLVDADMAHRVAGALRVYARGLGQSIVPWRLSGDYSYPAEPVPDRLVFPESVIGGLALVLPPLIALGLWIWMWRKEHVRRKAGDAGAAYHHWFALLLAVALFWIPVAYFPHSNIPVLLPTVRAERFWYLPVIGTSILFGAVMSLFLTKPRWERVALLVTVALFGFQAARARMHALDYTDDLTFWRATRAAVPNSAKAQLNYSVMVGAHLRDLNQRLAYNGEAMRLAPQWPMAHIYYGDTLCRMQRAPEAWPHYVKGFELGPNDPNLIALAMQCLWDEKAIPAHESELLQLSERHPGSWLAYFATEIVYHGEQTGGVEKKYRPRGYDEGPKD
jgi:hypothetical protein